MNRNSCAFILSLTLLGIFEPAHADSYEDTVKVFKNAGESGNFFTRSYGYAIFPTIGKAAFIVGGAYGKGRVYEHGNYAGDVSMTQGTLGFQFGGQAYSEIIFLQDKRAFNEFTGGNFEFGAEASAVVVTAGASAQATTTGSSAGISGGKNDATTRAPGFYKGMAMFIVARGGLMIETSIGGQKFTYTPKHP